LLGRYRMYLKSIIKLKKVFYFQGDCANANWHISFFKMQTKIKRDEKIYDIYNQRNIIVLM